MATITFDQLKTMKFVEAQRLLSQPILAVGFQGGFNFSAGKQIQFGAMSLQLGRNDGTKTDQIISISGQTSIVGILSYDDLTENSREDCSAHLARWLLERTHGLEMEDYRDRNGEEWLPDYHAIEMEVKGEPYSLLTDLKQPLGELDSNILAVTGVMVYETRDGGELLHTTFAGYDSEENKTWVKVGDDTVLGGFVYKGNLILRVAGPDTDYYASTTYDGNMPGVYNDAYCHPLEAGTAIAFRVLEGE